MSEEWKSELFNRLWRLPGQLLLALVNGTSILVIVAAVLAVIACSRVSQVAQNVASTMTDSVLSRVDGHPSEIAQNLQKVSDDVHTLLTAIYQTNVDAFSRNDSNVAGLSARLSTLEDNIKQLQDARSILIEEAMARVGIALGERLLRVNACTTNKAAL